jgi:hypothetical protein
MLIVAVTPQQLADVTTSVANTNQHPTALEPLWEDPRMVATAVGAVAVAAAAAVAEIPPTVAAEELVTAEAEATRAATPPAALTSAMMPTTGMMRSAAPRRLLKSATATASPPTLHNFAICFSPKNSSLSESPSTTRSKTQFSCSVVMPCC